MRECDFSTLNFRLLKHLRTVKRHHAIHFFKFKASPFEVTQFSRFSASMLNFWVIRSELDPFFIILASSVYKINVLIEIHNFANVRNIVDINYK